MDLEAFIGHHPEHAGPLRQLVPALEMMGELKRSAARDAVSPGPSDRDPRLALGVLGDFRIVREVGRGGMGIVYEAQQLSLDRRVALKVLPLAAAIDGKQLQRFQLEAHAAACLHHTNIVPVHAVGCEHGVPFYAMQYIEGRSLAQLITELRRLDRLDQADHPATGLGDISTSTLAANLASGRFVGAIARPANRDATAFQDEPVPATPASRPEPRALTPRPGGESPTGSSTRSREYIRTVAQFGVQVAEALDHAHTRGILHRDIKPANLLLDDNGQLWVTDFGLAQIQGNPALTLTGDIVGTLRYMSPEQALAKRVVIDGRTDIYSLGVTLYELLTLRPAFDDKDRQETLRKIAEDEPAPPRKLNPAVPRDLETILVAAMAKDPTSRYATAKDLADELRRFLENKPIKARRPSLLDQAAKWARRHPAPVASAIVLVVVALVVLSVGLVLVNREKGKTSLAVAAEAKRRAQARNALDAMTSLMLEDFLARQHALTSDHQKFLRRALQAYEEFAADTTGDEASRAGAARALANVGRIRFRLSPTPDSANLLRDAVGRLEQLVAAFPEQVGYRREQATAQRELGRALGSIDRRDEALFAFTAALAIGECLIADYPDVPEYRREQALNHFHLGVSENRIPEAETALQNAIALLEPLVAQVPLVPEDRLLLARAEDSLSGVLASTGRSQEAISACRAANAIFRRLVKESPTSAECRLGLAKSYNNLANRLKTGGRPEEIEKAYREALALLRPLAQELPAVPQHRLDLAKCLQNLGVLLQETRRMTAAEPSYRDALAVTRRLVEDYPTVLEHRSLLGTILSNLALLFEEIGNIPEAENTLGEALDVREKLVADRPDAHPYQNSLAFTLLRLAILRRGQKQFRASCDALQQALPHHQATLKSNPRNLTYQTNYAENRMTLAQNQVDLGDHGRAATAIHELTTAVVESPKGDEIDYAAASCLARCTALALKDNRLTEENRKQKANDYAHRAVERLRAAVQRGFKDLHKIKSDHVLDALRTREDFQRLLAEVDVKRKE